MKILVINGPNINMVGIREPGIYGKNTYADLLALLEQTAKEENIELMKKTGTVCLLWASAKTVYNRLSEDTSRPLLQNKKSVEEIQTMMNSREKYYRNAADITVDVDEMTPETVASELVKELALKGVLH